MATVVEDSVALSAEAVSKRYGDRTALREVSFQARRGELVAVIGPNGAGKTTLLQILAGALTPSSGHVSLPPQRVGWVPQQPALYRKLSVAENLRLFARLEGADPGAVERMLEQTGLRDRAGDEVGRLSGGNQQRVNIAIGLLRSPDALMLDEPSAALDPRQRERLWSFIGGLAASGTAVVYATHDVGEAERYADRVLVLADGDLLFSGTPKELEEVVDAERAEGRAAAAGALEASSGDRAEDFESAFVRFLHARGH